MENSINVHDLEQFYEQQVLPHYGIAVEKVQWISHDKIGLDTFAHYFRYNDIPYTLVFEDFPGEAHFIAEDSDEVVTTKGERTVHFPIPVDGRYVENKTGYFSLYRDR